jgi:iron complex transport system substrate-binding protein
MRVASLLPSATEIVACLGLRDALVGVTHECDWPPGVDKLPHLTANLLDPAMSSRAIDAAVSRSLKEDAHTIYGLDAVLLRDLAPDVILTQALCEVCAVPTNMVEDAVCTMPAWARIVSLDPFSLKDVFRCVEQAAEALGVPRRGAAEAGALRSGVAEIRDAVAGATRPRVLAAEWLDPIYCGGHWVPEMIDVAGGVDAFNTPGERSHPVPFDDILRADPDVIVLMPCGYPARDVIARYPEIASTSGWSGLRAVRECNVYAVDATSYFSRPGPRVVEGTCMLARIFHPDRVRVPPRLPGDDCYRLQPDGRFVAYK